MAERTALDRNLHELEDRARQAADWRTHHRNHPGVTVSLAFGAGVLLGLMSIPSASGRRSHATHDDSGAAGHEWASLQDAYPQPLRPSDDGPSRAAQAARKARAGLAAVGHTRTANRVKEELTDTWSRIADTLLVLASEKAVEFVADMVPGFADRFGRDRETRPAAAAR